MGNLGPIDVKGGHIVIVNNNLWQLTGSICNIMPCDRAGGTADSSDRHNSPFDNTMSSSSLQARAQVATADFQNLQVDLKNSVDARQRLDAQLRENEMVKKVQQ